MPSCFIPKLILGLCQWTARGIVTIANRNWQKMSHLGSPADKKCDIFTTGILIFYSNNGNKMLSCISPIPLFLIIFLPFFPNISTTSRLRLK